MATEPARALKILHVLRAPVGGLFRHVIDLAGAQAARGHAVGLIADATTGGNRAEAALAALAPRLLLGVTRVPMSRHIDHRDIAAVAAVARRVGEVDADVLHGHGAKGGAYARLARAPRAIRVYTPHGGSLHYRWLSPVGFLYLAAERALMRRTDLMLFESAYGRDTFRAKIGNPPLARVVHNGLAAGEFAAIGAKPDATDLVFIGELRVLKGVDVLLDAIALVAREGRAVTATIIGDGPDAAAFRAKADALELGGAVRFVGALPAQTGFGLGRLLVVPSRAESLPYIVLEAAAASVPMIATDVGGMKEIFGPETGSLVPPGDAAALARALAAAMAQPVAAQAAALRLRERVAEHFSADAMTEAVLAAYGEVLAARHC
ncbi:MAG TPA: glycosyltransferase family 4 protein [Xanthobacteraceae bacterium]|nr:glycosyltransferase family 4 protein [Xanthobacteraceae bacterium]